MFAGHTIIAFLLALSSVVARADSVTTGGTRIINNPISNGDFKLRVNVGGSPTDALAVTGSTGNAAFSNLVALPNGAVGGPSLRFSNSLTTGFYRVGADVIGIATNGVAAGNIDSSQIWTIGPALPTTTKHPVDGILNFGVTNAGGGTNNTGILWAGGALSVASGGGTSDFTVPKGLGILSVRNSSNANDNRATNTVFFYSNMGVTSPSTSSLGTQNGSGAGESFAVTFPAQTTLRVTNNGTDTTDIRLSIIGIQTN